MKSILKLNTLETALHAKISTTLPAVSRTTHVVRQLLILRSLYRRSGGNQAHVLKKLNNACPKRNGTLIAQAEKGLLVPEPKQVFVCLNRNRSLIAQAEKGLLVLEAKRDFMFEQAFLLRNETELLGSTDSHVTIFTAQPYERHFKTQHFRDRVPCEDITTLSIPFVSRVVKAKRK